MEYRSKRSFAVEPSHKPGPRFTYRNHDHTPYNKRPGQVHRSSMSLEIVDCEGKSGSGHAPWLSISLTEATQARKDGPFLSRTLFLELDEEGRTALLKMLARESFAAS